VDDAIRQFLAYQIYRVQPEQVTVDMYINFLRFSGRSEQEIRQVFRTDLAGRKVQEIIRLAYHATEPELRDMYRRENTKYSVEYLRFNTSDMLDEVEVGEEGLQAFFEEHLSDYTVPEKVKLRYLRLSPRDFEPYVPVLASDVQDYYDRNFQRLQQPESAAVDAIFFPASDYVGDVTANEEILQSYLQMNREEFTLPERRVIRYTYAAVTPGASSEIVPAEDVRKYYEENIGDYKINEAQARASQILLILDPEASPAEEEEVLNRLRTVRGEIEAGKPFGEAAREYSEDQLTKDEGGGLGWFNRRGTRGPEDPANPYQFQMDRITEQKIIEEAFSLPVGGISEPFRTSRGYHILKVDDRKDERVQPLAEVEEDIRSELATERLQRLRFEARETGFEEAVNAHGYPLVTTEPFDRSVETIDPIIGASSRWVARDAFNLATGEISNVVSQADNYLLFELAQVLPENTQTLAEAHDEILASYRLSRAKLRAEKAAEDALDRIGDQGVSLADIASETGKEVLSLGPFHSGESIPELGDQSGAFIPSALQMKQGQIDTIGTPDGVYLVHVTSYEEARVPEINEIKDRIERAVRREKSTIHTADLGNDILSVIDEFDGALADSVELASRELQMPVPQKALGETRLLAKGENADVIGWAPNVTDAGLRLKEAGDRYSVPVPAISRPGSPVTDYFLLELVEKVPEHDPELAEVREEVENDYRYQLAAAKAKERADEVYAELQKAIEAGTFQHPSRTIDLLTFSTETGTEYEATSEPFAITSPPWGSDLRGATAVLKTISGLEPGELSGVIEVSEETSPESDKPARIRGYYIVQVIDREEADMDKFAEAEDALRDRVQRQLLYNSYRSWMDSVERSATVERKETLKKQLAYERGEISEDEFYDSQR
jgi:parvulin-like peptidyl-prolyl isomerase